jgi:hypothetical protein
VTRLDDRGRSCQHGTPGTVPARTTVARGAGFSFEGARAEPAGALAAAGQGLVTYAITGREVETVPDYVPLVRDVWAPKFPRADLVAVAAGQFVPLPAWLGEEGPRFRIVISPGAMAVGSRDLARAERTWESQERARQSKVEMIAAYIHEHGIPPQTPLPTREITTWSRKSRANMFRAFSELDYAPLLGQSGIPAMVTLTYPADWLTVAPVGKAVKAHFKAFRKRWERTWGVQLLALWKLEFQARGAPHLHLFTVVPDGRTEDGKHFREWLSAAWAAVVAHPDPEEYRKHRLAGTGVDYAAGLRSSDPRRIAVYFSKHASFSAKEYQNIVPAEWREPGKGPGRFWGYWGLERCTRAVEVTPHAATLAARTMRRWARAQGVTRQMSVPRSGRHEINPAFVHGDGAVIGLSGLQLTEGKVRRRKVRRRVQRMYRGRGWISLNDGPEFAMAVARYLSQVP